MIRSENVEEKIGKLTCEMTHVLSKPVTRKYQNFEIHFHIGIFNAWEFDGLSVFI